MRYTSVQPELIDALAEGWNTLTLSVEAPDRVPSWDAIVLTAASSRQAAIYERRLSGATRRGLIPESTHTLVVPDPGGQRIGSGGATLNALRSLGLEFPPAADHRSRVLLVHAGGDSRRLAWANVFGKPFIPVPLLADPDRGVPSLFDQLLAVFAPLAVALQRGGLVSATGDVLPLFSASTLSITPDSATVVTSPQPLDTAGRHGVIAPGPGESVRMLLQKPSVADLCQSQALVGGGAALVDTGIYVFTGKASQALFRLSRAEPSLVEQLMERPMQLSLYGEIAAALVPAHRAGLRGTAIGRRLVEALQPYCLRQERLDSLAFYHFGSSSEVLHHLHEDWLGQCPSRVLTDHGPNLSPSSCCYSSTLAQGARVGTGTLVLDADLGGDVRIGNRCVVVNAVAHGEPLTVPDNTCLWQLPVSVEGGEQIVVTACCGVDDNPKASLPTALFCNRLMTDWMSSRGILEARLWAPGEPRTLWHARLFPVLGRQEGLRAARWLLTPEPHTGKDREEWLGSRRLSLHELHHAVDVDRLLHDQDERRGAVAMRTIRRVIEHGLERNVRALSRQVPAAAAACAWEDLARPSHCEDQWSGIVPRSRGLQIKADLHEIGGLTEESRELHRQAFGAVHDEVCAAIHWPGTEPVSDLPHGIRTRSQLPVRFDLAGGWSDTPPYCLERPAGVLNMAICLSGAPPVAVTAEALSEQRWSLTLGDTGQTLDITDAMRTEDAGSLSDPFSLLRQALALAGYGSRDGITQGVRLTTHTHVPKGSGLGTSSILGAAIMTALQELAGRPSDPATVSDLVLALEQVMTTGGGWQDQIGGLVRGVKFVSSIPSRPLQLNVQPVPLLPPVKDELRSRLVVAFSGQERLAKNVLQIVVGRYLQRDRRLIEAIEGLVWLARQARQALTMGDLDELGRILREVWALHQQLDPHCSSPAVDAIFHDIDGLASGYKLAGAGGGGFMGILAKSAEAAATIRKRLSGLGQGVQVYEWDLA